MLISLRDLNNFISFFLSFLAELPISKVNHLRSSIGLSNPTLTKNQNAPISELHSRAQSLDSNLDKIRHIILNEPSGLYFNTLPRAHNDQTQTHFITSIQPISAAHRAGLRNGDRILTVNGADVSGISQEDLRALISKTKPIALTVVKDSKLQESIANSKRKTIPKVFSNTFYETFDHQKSKDLNNLLFTDDQGPVYIKRCIAKKEPQHDALGFSIVAKDGFHTIINVETNLPAYNSGLRDQDIVLFVNKKNVQQLQYEELMTFLRPLIRSNQTVDLITLQQKDVQRYRDYQKKRYIDWYSVLSKMDEHPVTSAQSEFCLIKSIRC